MTDTHKRARQTLVLLIAMSVACFGGCGDIVETEILGEQNIGPDASMLLMEPAQANFAETDTALQLRFRNTTEYDLPIVTSVIYGSSSDNWLTITPKTAQCISEQDILFRLAADRSALPAGLHVAEVGVTAAGIRKSVLVSIAVVAVAASIEAKDFGSSEQDFQFQTWNVGGGTLRYQIDGGPSWLTVENSAGSSSGSQDHQTVSLSVDRTGLTPGSYTGQFTIRPVADQIGTSKIIGVTIVVPEPGTEPVIPPLTIQPSTTGGEVPLAVNFVAMDGSSPAASLPAGSTLNWEFGDDTPVAHGNQVSHTFTRSGQFLVALSLTLAGELGTVGCHQTTVKVSAVSIVVPGSLVVTPDNDHIATGLVGGPFSPNSIPYTLRNPGDTAIAWTAGAAAPPWIHLSKSSGTLAAGAADTVTVSFNAAATSLPASGYGGKITFVNVTNGTGNTDRDVALTVNAWPAALSANAGGNKTISAGSSVVLNGSASAGTAPYTYSWSPNTGLSASNVANPTASPAATTTYTLTAHDAVGTTATSTATVTVNPAPSMGAVRFISGTYSVAENISGGTVRIYVSRTGGSYGVASVNYTTANGTAAAGSDYAATSGTLSWADGDAADKYIDVAIINDSLFEGNETFIAVLSGASGAALGSPSQTTVTITNDDAAPGVLSVTPATGLTATGAPGGQFSPNSTTYTLTNTGGSNINWTAGKTQSWVSLSKGSGTLAGGATDTVIVTFAAGVSTLVVGSYNDTVTFGNITNGSGNTSRTVTLSISHAAGEPTAAFRAECISGQAPLTVLFNATDSTDSGGNVSDYAWDFSDANSAYTAQYGTGAGQQINGRHEYGKIASHRFDNPGTYTIRLTVRDNENNTATAEATVTVSEAAGTVYYVRADGNDLADGRTDATAWASLTKVGIAIGAGQVRSGDRVLFRRGDVFPGHVYINTCASTRATPITLGAYGTGARPELRQAAESDDAILYLRNMPEGSGLVLQGLCIRRTAWASGSALMSYYWQTRTYPHLTIRDCEIEGGHDGITYLFGSSLTIEDSVIHGAQRQGLKGDTPDTLIRHCYFHNNGTSVSFDHNIYFTDNDNSLVEDSRLESGSGGGLTAHGVISNLIIRRNVVANNNVGISVTGGYASAESFTGVLIESNDIFGNVNMGIYANSMVNSIISNNVMHNNGTTNGTINLSAGSSGDAMTADTLIAHNVLYGDGTLLTLSINQASSNTTVKNNIFNYFGLAGMRYCISHISQVGQLVSAKNMFYSPQQAQPFAIAGFNKSFAQWQTAGFDAGSLLTDPRFADPMSSNFTLNPMSPGIGTGETLWQVPRDYLGSIRAGTVDVGAYQR